VTVYTVGTWVVKPDREHEFVDAWDALARWTVESGWGSHGTLLRDREQSNRFVSFAPWPSADDVERWRGSAGFREQLERVRDTLESFEPGTFDVVLRVS
jgi:heme-degrading monooxygenase HmoA